MVMDLQTRQSPDARTTIDNLIAQLTCQDVAKCRRARQTLVGMGRSAIAPLINALKDPNKMVRWEAAKALGQIGDPATG